jgi:predicted SprT family Zn-dependent metalloprotease
MVENAFDDDDIDDWETIEECDCESCAPQENPRAARAARKRGVSSEYADLDSINEVIEQALSKHGLTMDGIAEVKFTRGGKSRAGACAYSRSLRQCKIMFNGLAWPAFTEEQRLNTILHEAAHAIQFLTTGRSDHGPVWQRIAKSIGCTGERCMSVEASQVMVDAYAEAKGLPKRKVITKDVAREGSDNWNVGDYVELDYKGDRWPGKIVRKGETRATVLTYASVNGALLKTRGASGKEEFGGRIMVPYPLLRPSTLRAFAEAVVDTPAAREMLRAAGMQREDVVPAPPPQPRSRLAPPRRRR